MQISHVTRTEEWLPSTPKHILLYEYFGWEAPAWAHLPLLLNPDKTKMSKRKGDVMVGDYIKKGYLPEAMINFLAFLGWNPGLPAEALAKAGTEKEIYSMQELLKDFSLEKVHKAGAIFNIEKLNWYNQYYMRQIPLDKLTELCIPYLIENDLIVPKFDHSFDIAAMKGPFTVKDFETCLTKEKISFDYIKKAVALEQERSKTLSEIGESVKFFFEEPQYDKSLLFWKDTSEEEIKKSLQTLQKIISDITEKKFKKENLQEIIMPEAEKLSDRGIMLWPLRAALSGQKASPGPFEIAEVLGKEKTFERISFAIKKLD